MRPDRFSRALAWLFAALLPCQAAPATAGEAPLELTGTAPYYGLQVPLEVLAQTRSASLSDIQVLNGRGEPVPHAWADQGPTVSSHERRQTVPLFKAPERRSPAASGVAAPPREGWIVDARKVRGALTELQLSVAAGSNGIYAFALEHSTDLQRWRTLRPTAQLVSLQREGLRLEHTRFDLEGVQAGYLRLRPLPGAVVPPLSGALVASTEHYVAAAPRQWSEPIAPTRCDAQHCDYTLPRHLPLEWFEWQLAEANTLAPVRLLAKFDTAADAGGTTDGARPDEARHRRHPIRDHLRGLRHKTAPPQTNTDTDTGWYTLRSTSVYWLRLPDGEVRSPEQALGAGLVTELRIQPAGGMAQLGSRPPLLRVGASTASLVFLAREPAPFRLAWGGADATSAMSLAQLMPTRRPGDPVPRDTARVTLVPPASVAASAPASAPVATAAASAPRTGSRKVWLWAALLVALGLMGAMAWALLRPGQAAVKPD